MPAEIGQMASLQLLNLSYQRGSLQNGVHLKFSGPIPQHITRLNKLAELHLQNNDFSGALPPQIWRMESLELIFAQNNRLQA